MFDTYIQLLVIQTTKSDIRNDELNASFGYSVSVLKIFVSKHNSIPRTPYSGKYQISDTLNVRIRNQVSRVYSHIL